MGKSAVFLLIFVFSTIFICAEEDDAPPPGMKIEKAGDLEILVPKDAKVERTGKGGLISVESTSEYVSRKLLDMEERFKRIEKNQEKLKEEIEQLKKAVK